MTARKTVAETMQDAASKSASKGRKVTTAPKTTGVVNATVQMYEKEFPVIKGMFNTIEVGEWKSAGKGFIAQVSLKHVTEVNGVKVQTRTNWVKFWRDELTGPFSIMKVSWKNKETNNWERAKVSTVAGTKIEEEGYDIRNAISRITTKILWAQEIAAAK
jgi:hypothetical protein